MGNPASLPQVKEAFGDEVMLRQRDHAEWLREDGPWNTSSSRGHKIQGKQEALKVKLRWPRLPLWNWELLLRSVIRSQSHYQTWTCGSYT